MLHGAETPPGDAPATTRLHEGLLWISVSLVAGLCAWAMVLLLRRIGWAEPPLSMLSLAITALMAAATAWLSTLLWLALAPATWAGANRCAGCQGVMRWLPSLALAGIGTAATVPTAPASVVAALWVIWGASELVRHQLWANHPKPSAQPAALVPRDSLRAITPDIANVEAPTTVRQTAPTECRSEPVPDEGELTQFPQVLAEDTSAESNAEVGDWFEQVCTDPQLVQFQTRRREEDGIESVHTVLRIQLAATQRTVMAHLAFCPALPSAPQVEFEQVDGPECRINLAACLAHGIRLEIKRASAETPGEVLIEVMARSTATIEGDAWLA